MVGAQEEYPHSTTVACPHVVPGCVILYYISLGDDTDYAKFLGFRGLATLLPNFCQLSVPGAGVCGVYSESP